MESGSDYEIEDMVIERLNDLAAYSFDVLVAGSEQAGWRFRRAGLADCTHAMELPETRDTTPLTAAVARTRTDGT